MSDPLRIDFISLVEAAHPLALVAIARRRRACAHNLLKT